MEKLRQGPMLHLGVKGLDDDDDDIHSHVQANRDVLMKAHHVERHSSRNLGSHVWHNAN